MDQGAATATAGAAGAGGIALARTVVTAVAYVALGQLAGILAIAPGYATPVWPSAGVAVVSVILWGRAGAVGSFLGALVLNLIIGFTGAHTPPATIVASALAVAVGTVAQCYLAARLATRATGPGNPLLRGGSLVTFLVLAGPVACLFNAIWSPVWLQVLGAVPPPLALQSAVTWWVGDTIGVLVVAPLLLDLDARSGPHWLRRWLSLAVPLAVCLVGVGAVFHQSQAAEARDLRSAFEDRARLVSRAVIGGVDRVAAYTETVGRAFGALPAIDRSAFRALVRPWLAVNPAVEAIEWMPLVPGTERAAFERATDTADWPGFHIQQLRPDGTLGPAGPADFYAPVVYVEPIDREARVVGYDLASQPDRRRALEETRDTGALVATNGVRLVLFPGEWGVLVISATYAGIQPPTTLAERRAEVRGFVATVIRVDVLVQDALSRADGRGLDIRVTDLSTVPPRVLSGPAATATPTEALTWSTFHAVGGRTWRLDVFTNGPAPRSWAGWGVLAAGLACTGLVVAFVIDARTRADRVELLVGDRTAALEHANAALARSNLELQRFAYVASHDMREPLRSVRSFSELLAREYADKLGPSGTRHLGRVIAATARMQALVTDLLEFARIESRVEPFVAVPLSEPVAAALDDLDAVLRETGAEVTIGDLPTVRCDRVQMVQLFQNLVSNAVKFRRPDVRPRVAITARMTSEGCEVSVADNGIGIEQRHWDRIFDIYQRLHTEAAYPGRGIGLATCRRIVERHGGRIWVESVPGDGSIFRFTLQCAEGT